ncbi:MAG: TonB-dependent receptor [Methylococcaceae bacterium]|nr:TonB-dependent receptor [Methylococcaceae bacterium]
MKTFSENKKITINLFRMSKACFLLPLVFLSFSINAEDTSYLELEDMTVNARMRSEKVQEVPMSITHYSSENIDDAKIDRISDFIRLTPNVSLSESQSIGTSFLTIRGISQVRNGEPPVATVIDGVLQTNSRQFPRELYDIESIEVLRGPQGALYGRNAVGGAILINTRQPTNEWESHWRFGYGQADEYLTQATISGALIEDELLLRLSGRYLEHEGYLNNSFLQQKVDYKEDLSFKGQLKWLASERLNVDLNFKLSREKAGGLNFTHQPTLLGADNASLDPTLAEPFDFTHQGADQVTRNFTANNLGKSEREMEEVSLKVEYFADFATLTSISSWHRVEESVLGDQFPYTAGLTRSLFGGALVVDGGQSQFVDMNIFSQEFRITSDDDEDFRWVLGAYFLSTERFISTTSSDDKGLGLIKIERQPTTDSRNPTSSFLGDDNDNTAWAVFANFAYDLTADLEASFAMRYDSDRRRQTVSSFNTSGEPNAVNKKTFSKFQPLVALRYQLLPEISMYGSWGIGFHSGQFNQNGVGAVAAKIGLEGVEDVTKSEETENFELGFKSEWFNKQLQINGSFFVTEQKNRPYFVFLGEINGQVLVNIDEVEIIGGELEINNRWMEGLDSYVSFGYTSSNIEKYTLNPSLVSSYAPYIPEYTFNAGLQYRTPLNQWLGFFGRVDFERRGKQFWDPENSTARSAINLLNLKVGFEDPNKNWSLMFLLDNATDEKYNSEWVAGGFSHSAQPRNWHVDFQISF